MFKVRLMSGIVLVILAIGVLYFGGAITAVTMLLLSLIGVFEILKIQKLNNTLIGYASYMMTIIYYGLLVFDFKQYIMPLIVVYVLVLLAIYVITFPTYKDKDFAIALMSFFYVTLMLSYVYQIRMLENGGALVVMIFVCSWGNDTLAYCAGVTLGKHKMAPKLSPKKSIEGLIGGILGAAILAYIYGIFFEKNVYELNNAPIIFCIVGALGAITAVIGDLAASAIKRDNEIKDYGKLIPGHGGVMDRFDSIIFTAPIIYYYFIFTMSNLGGLN